MPLLFKPDMARAILAGTKTVTRRRWKTARVKVGNVYQTRTKMFGEPFARLRVTWLTWEKDGPGGLLFTDAERDWEADQEGFGSWDRFCRRWVAMYGETALHEPCWRILFAVVKEREE